jgi:hypothetical protein
MLYLNSSLWLLLFVSIPTISGKTLLRSAGNHNHHQHHRQLQTAVVVVGNDQCDTLQGCYFVNIQTRHETKLVTSTANTISIDPTNIFGYSIRCDITDTVNGTLNVLKYKYNNLFHDEFDTIRYMEGDSNDAAWINPVSYFTTCGNKQVIVEGLIWTASCFEETFNIQLVCTSTCPIEIDNFILVDTTERNDIMELSSYSQTSFPQNLTIRAAVPTTIPPQCKSESVNSVQFEFNGVPVRCESYMPYALFGDASRMDILDLSRANYYSKPIPIGTHTIRATPYTGEGCTGTAATPLSRTFTVSP